LLTALGPVETLPSSLTAALLNILPDSTALILVDPPQPVLIGMPLKLIRPMCELLDLIIDQPADILKAYLDRFHQLLNKAKFLAP